MKRVENPELQSKALRWLADKYHILDTREPNHLSTYIYCRTKAYFDQHQAVEPTEEEILLFALGYGLQDTLAPPDIDAKVHELDGITFSPDITIDFNTAEKLVEVKTTRRSAKKHDEDEAILDTWRMYMMGGCKIRGTNKYDLIIIYLMGNYAPPFPQLKADSIEFTDEEIELNWQEILSRKAVLDTALSTSKLPTPYEHNEMWECNNCRYKLICEVVTKEGLKNG
jgi:CRISPR/Cas system-associated exonuclease Cas4 (RecB family)